MALTSRRASLLRGRKWPLSTLDLREGLGDLFDAVSIVWHDTPADPYALWVSWNGEASRAPTETSVAVWITGADAAVAESTGAILRTEVLPELVTWLTAAFDEGDSWQALNHAKWWTVGVDRVTSREHDESPRRNRRRRF